MFSLLSHTTANLIDGILVAFLYRHPKVYIHENFSVYPQLELMPQRCPYDLQIY